MALLASYMAACLEADLTAMWTAPLVIVETSQALSEAVRICGRKPIKSHGKPSLIRGVHMRRWT